MNFDKALDARPQLPAAVVRTKKSLGELLKASSTDPGSAKDMQVFARQTDNEPLSTAENGGEFVFLMRKH